MESHSGLEYIVKKTALVGCTFIHSERFDCPAIIIRCG